VTKLHGENLHPQVLRRVGIFFGIDPCTTADAE